MREQKDEFLIGRKPILDALSNRKAFEKIWIDQSIRGEFEKEVRFLCKNQAIPLISCPGRKLNDLVKKTNHQGIVGQISLVMYHKLMDVLPFLYENGKTPRLILLDGVEDVRNLGAIARSAVWFGFNTMVVPMKESARINAFAMKTSAGALTEIMVCREKSLVSSIEFLQASGVKVYAADMVGEQPNQIDNDGPIALVVGSEEAGISQKIRQVSDKIIAIPGDREKIESLNVSVAAAVLMYECFKT